MTDKTSDVEAFLWLGVVVICLALLMVFGVAFIVGVILYRTKPFFVRKHKKAIFFISLTVLLVLFPLAMESPAIRGYKPQKQRTQKLVDNPLIASTAIQIFGIALVTASTIFWSVGVRRKNRIVVNDLYGTRPKELDLVDDLYNPYFAPIGKSLLTKDTIWLEQRKRCQHTLVVGSTGSGKTTLMKVLICHAMKNNQPAIIIDPKGNLSNLYELQNIAIHLGYDRSKIRYFSLSNPVLSENYNPLKRGDAITLKDRIMESFEWSEKFYMNRAKAYLTSMLSVFEAMQIPCTLHNIKMVLSSPRQEKLLGNELEKKVKAGVINQEILDEFHLSQVIDKPQLAALLSQLSDLDNQKFGKLLSDTSGAREIDFIEVLRKKQIAYFQLNTLGLGPSSRALGRLILNDIKAFADDVYQEKIEKPEFLPIFIDEFGSYATTEFGEFLKLCREANFATHLFCQSLSDLIAISKQFLGQVLDDTIYKIFSRTDDPAAVEIMSAIAGTEDAIEESYQVKKNIFNETSPTGLGNRRITKQMRIEHDVFKRLSTGQAILIEKSPYGDDLVQLWNPDFFHKSSSALLIDRMGRSDFPKVLEPMHQVAQNVAN